MRVCLMIEGQEDVTWQQWTALARACEDAGLEALFRSDHYLSVSGRAERGSLDAWATLAGLAAGTERIRLGTLVSPATFRHPAVLAKTAVTVDHISGGRVEVGLGVGWHEAEHRAYGFEFPGVRTRMERFAEQAEILHRSWSEEEFSFDGGHYRVEQLAARPRSVQRPHPPLIVGGAAGPASAAVAARFADEYNTIFVPPEECARRRERVARAFEQHGRDPATLVFSLMTACLVGEDGDDLRRRARAVLSHAGREGDGGELLERLRGTGVVGTIDDAAEQLRALEEAGVARVMLQHQDHTDLEMVRLLGALSRAVA